MNKELRQQLSDVNDYINYTNKSLDLLRKAGMGNQANVGLAPFTHQAKK